MNEIPGAIPQIVNLGEAQPAGDYFVAYTTAPQVLSPIKKNLKGRVLLFVKEKRLPPRVYRKYPHVELRPTTPDFAEYLARSTSIIADFAPRAASSRRRWPLGKPIYLFLPEGHIEQEYNLRCTSNTLPASRARARAPS